MAVVLIRRILFNQLKSRGCREHLIIPSSSTAQNAFHCSKHSSTMTAFVRPCLDAFKAALDEMKPSLCVKKALCLRGDQLTVHGQSYRLARNVHIVAIGKAASGMVEGAEEALGPHFVDGIASVPVGTKCPPNLRTRFLCGAHNNLPDAEAMRNASEIERFVEAVKAREGQQIILFLISGGGSSLLPAPIPGVSLGQKLELIQLLQRNGAEIRQLNAVRTALSRLKGGGLARLGHPAKMVGLIISDIVGDPVELISSGPTVVVGPGERKDPIAVLDELGVKDQVDPKLLDAMQQREEQQQQSGPVVDVHCQNVIVASNAQLLELLAQHMANNLQFVPVVVTNRLEGDASRIGRAMARFLMKLTKMDGFNEKSIAGLLDDEGLLPTGERPKFGKFQGEKKPLALLFGGESTVRFDHPEWLKPDTCGGRNQELVLAAFHELLGVVDAEICRKFALFSLGTDGQDGPTDAAGAFISSDDVQLAADDRHSINAELFEHLIGKDSYHFWSAFNDGRNLFRPGKTGMNVMDVQMMIIDL